MLRRYIAGPSGFRSHPLAGRQAPDLAAWIVLAVLFAVTILGIVIDWGTTP